MNKINKTQSLVSRLTAAAAAGSLVTAVSVFAPQAIAADAVDMELKIQQMEESLRLMRDELKAVREESRRPVERVDSLEERVTMVELSDDYRKKNKSQIFFRGGYLRSNVSRRNQVFTDLFADDNSLPAVNNGKDAWYIGAGIDHSLSDDLFGLWDGAELLGEINFQYAEFNSADGRKAFGSHSAARVVPVAATALQNNIGLLGGAVGSPLNVNSDVTGNGFGVLVTQFTLSASPKIKFLPDSAIRPWIIPIGLDIHVISPPSDGGTYITAGAQFAGGVEWNIWQNVVLGVDVRYHWAPQIEGVDPRYWQAGGSIGFLF